MTDCLKFKIVHTDQPATRSPLPAPAEAKALRSFEDYESFGWEVLLVPFGGPISGRDAEGEAFHAGTDLMLNIGDTRPATYYHGFGPDDPYSVQEPPVVIGSLRYARMDERGHWFDLALDESEELARRLIAAGPENVRASSGAVGHLVRMGQAGMIDVWPVGEGALFDINDWRLPANDYAVVQSKSLPQPDVEPEGALEAAAAVKSAPVQSETVEPTIPEITPTMENAEMEITPEMQTVIDGAVAKALEEKLPAQFKSAPAVTKSPKESPSFGKALCAWLGGDTPAGFAKGKEMNFFPESAVKAGNPWEGGTDNEGGYAVPDDFYNGIVEKRDLESWVRKAPVQKFTTNRDRILIATESTAGTKLVVTDEEAAYDEDEEVFGQVALTIYKFTKMKKISEELVDGDAVGLERYLTSVIARAQAKAENYYLTVGTGGGMPQGLVAGSTSSTVMMATADTIVSTDITGARGKLDAGWDVPGEVAAIMAPSVFWYIKGITGDPFQFISTPAGNDLLGEPVYLAPDCDALTVHSGKVITWFNYGAYAFAERQGLTVARNPYLYQANGQLGLFVKARFGGALLQALGTVHMLGHND